jgi:large subunit ribosomal protein L17
MRHKIATMKLTRDTDHRKALMRNLAAGLFISGRIKTTKPKARFVRGFAEKLITLAKKGTLNARRQVIALMQDRYIVDKDEKDVKRDKSFNVVKAPRLVKKLFDEIAPKYASVSGGYTRIINLATRRIGDNGEQVYLELVDPTQTKTTKKNRTGGNRKKKTQKRLGFYNKLLKGKKPEKQEKPAESAPATEEKSE